jgi:hypothetical protein
MSTLTLSPRQQAVISRRRETGLTFAVAALGLVVLAAVAIAVAVAISYFPDVDPLYITVT